MDMARISGGQLVVRALKAQGVRRIFTLPGAGIFPVYDACLTEGVALTAGRHEAAVVQAAEGWARVTGAPGVALVPEGPGHANAVAGLATAFGEGSPVVLLSGSDEHCCLGKGAMQELPQVAMCEPVSKGSMLLKDTADVGGRVAEAFRLAMQGVPGPVYITLCADVLEACVPEPAAVPSRAASPANASCGLDVTPGFAERAIALLAGAQRPVVLAGAGVYWSRAWPSLESLVSLSGLPLFTVERARGAVPDGHPCCFGDGYSSVNPAAELMHHADVVLVLGERIDCRFAYGRCFGSASVVHVYPDPLELGRTCRPALAEAGEVGAVIRSLLAAAREQEWEERPSWLDQLRQAGEGLRAEVANLARADEAPLHPGRVISGVAPFLDDTAVVVFDGGDVSGWARRVLPARGPGRWQTGTLLGQMGAGLPYALGAGLAEPENRAVLLTGDGALGFSFMEFETAVRCGLPVVVIVLNDASWGIERHLQARCFGGDRLVGTDLGNVRWDLMVQAMGGHGEFVETSSDLAGALERAFASGVPSCVNVATASVPSPVAGAFTRLLLRRRQRIRRRPDPGT